MQDIQTIYRQSILPLPVKEKLRLAAIILQDLTDPGGRPETLSALDLLQTLKDERVFASGQEVDDHLRAERESWDN